MKKIIRIPVALLLGLLLFVSFPTKASAATEELPNEVTFEIGQDSYATKDIFDTDGTYLGTITVEQIDYVSPMWVVGPVKNRGYTRVSYSNGLTRKASFEVSMSTNPNIITSAINPSYSILPGTVKEYSLTHTSTRAFLKLFVEQETVENSYTKTLEARIEGSNLTAAFY